MLLIYKRRSWGDQHLFQGFKVARYLDRKWDEDLSNYITQKSHSQVCSFLSLALQFVWETFRGRFCISALYHPCIKYVTH